MSQDAVEEVALFVDVRRFQNHNAMPHAGGVLDQDPRWVEALSIVDTQTLLVREALQQNGK